MWVNTGLTQTVEWYGVSSRGVSCTLSDVDGQSVVLCFLIVVNPHTGVETWRASFDQNLVSAVAASADTLYVCTQNQNLYFGRPLEEPLDSSVEARTFATGAQHWKTAAQEIILGPS